MSLPHARVAAIEVRESGEPLIDLRDVAALRLARRAAGRGDAPARLRLGIVDRLVTAQTMLPPGVRLLVLRGHRPAGPDALADACHPPGAESSAAPTGRSPAAFALPQEAPHATGAAVDLTLCTVEGVPLWMGPGPRFTRSPLHRSAAPNLDPVAAETRRHLRRAMTTAGFVNYPAAWWHWSYGDCYWAWARGARYAGYGPA